MYTYTHAYCTVVSVCVDILGRRGESRRGSGHQFVCVCADTHVPVCVCVYLRFACMSLCHFMYMCHAYVCVNVCLFRV